MIYKRAMFRTRGETTKKSRRDVTINRIYLRVNKPEVNITRPPRKSFPANFTGKYGWLEN